MCSVMAGLSGLLSFQQQRQQAKAQAESLRAQADAQRAQAQMYDNAAKAEKHKQEQIADSYAQQNAALRDRRRTGQAAAIAQAGAAGLGMNSGTSAWDILVGGDEAYSQDRINLLNNQRNDNYNSRVTESGYINQGNAARTSASNLESQARSTEKVSPWPTIIGTAAQIYGIESDAKFKKSITPKKTTPSTPKKGDGSFYEATKYTPNSQKYWYSKGV